MIKALIGATALSLTGSAAMAGSIYVNPEYNAGWSGSDFGGGILEAHVGYEEGPFYIQGGPAVLMPDGGEAETGFTAKTGISAPVTEDLTAYGEVSIGAFDDVDNTYGLKVGAKYKF
jgi:hypothetical protein